MSDPMKRNVEALQERYRALADVDRLMDWEGLRIYRSEVLRVRRELIELGAPDPGPLSLMVDWLPGGEIPPPPLPDDPLRYRGARTR
jgi:hypothetical protein